MNTEEQQIDGLKDLQLRLWREARLISYIIIGTGDVVALRLGLGFKSELVHVVPGLYDGWLDRGLHTPEMDADQALEWLMQFGTLSAMPVSAN